MGLFKHMFCWKGIISARNKVDIATIYPGRTRRKATFICDDMVISKSTKCESTNKPGHVYLIKEREFIKTNENIFKIGKSTNIKGRMPAYPKDSLIYMIAYCQTDVHTFEKSIIKRFDTLFTKRVDIGLEYYETVNEDHREIMYEFLKLVLA
jgi:hypothetical protein